MASPLNLLAAEDGRMRAAGVTANTRDKVAIARTWQEMPVGIWRNEAFVHAYRRQQIER
jgi:hypothetical protein